MKRGLRAPFVLTVSLLGSSACKKTPANDPFECKPPECHMNPPAWSPPPTEAGATNDTVTADGGVPDASGATNTRAPIVDPATPPTSLDAGTRLPTRNPPAIHSRDGGPANGR